MRHAFKFIINKKIATFLKLNQETESIKTQETSDFTTNVQIN